MAVTPLDQFLSLFHTKRQIAFLPHKEVFAEEGEPSLQKEQVARDKIQNS